jgi:hypothetical protein
MRGPRHLCHSRLQAGIQTCSKPLDARLRGHDSVGFIFSPPPGHAYSASAWQGRV